MQTDCNAEQIEFQALGFRKVQAKFDGGNVTSDAGGLLLREVEQRRKIIDRFARCFRDHRDPDLIEHSLLSLLSQRIFGLALGYEDLNDHDILRRDPLLAVLSGKEEPEGHDRIRERDVGYALAGKSTLNRLELTPADATGQSRYKKIVYDAESIERFFVELFVDGHTEEPEEIVLDLDATDDPVHGEQEGRFFHGYYGHYCFLPLYIFAGTHLLCAKLRPSNIDGAAGVLEELQRIIMQIRECWPRVRIAIRGDSGFARDEVMAWCEANGVDYILGLAKNSRLESEIATQLEHARRKHLRTKKAARCFRDFRYRTLKSWSRRRRVVGKAEVLDKGANPRFVVTSYPTEKYNARELYERVYCARGEMENRIKEQQMDLFADRTSCHPMRANQLRLWLSSVAYVLMSELRRLGLAGTELSQAQCGTIRTRLLKIGAVVRVSVRRVRLYLCSAFPLQALFWNVMQNIRYRYPLRT
jgi:hypothetical protein